MIYAKNLAEVFAGRFEKYAAPQRPQPPQPHSHLPRCSRKSAKKVAAGGETDARAQKRGLESNVDEIEEDGGRPAKVAAIAEQQLMKPD